MFPSLAETPLAYTMIGAVLVGGLIALNRKSFFDRSRLHPYSIYRGKRLYSLFTSLLCHISPRHLFLNTVLLIFILPEIEYMLRDDFGALIGSKLLLVSIAFVAVFAGNLSAIQYRNRPEHWSAGASTLILAMTMLYLLYFPLDPLPGIPDALTYLLPVWIAVILGVTLGFFVLLKTPAATMHLYGALAGVILAYLIPPFAPESEERDDEPSWDDHPTYHSQNDTASIRIFTAFTASDSHRLLVSQGAHARRDNHFLLCIHSDNFKALLH